MSEPNSTRQPDVWEKWSRVWDVIFYLTILVSIGMMAADGNRTAPLWLVLGLSALWMAWHTAGIRYVQQNNIAWDQNPQARFWIILGDILLWFALVLISPAYYIALFGLFLQVFRQLPIRYAIFAALLLTAAVLGEQFADTGSPAGFAEPGVWLYFLLGAGGIILGIWVSAIISQSTERRELIEQLEQAQQELAAAERREGVLQERQRLAGEIHDTLAQGFTSIVMLLNAVEHSLPQQTDPQVTKNLQLAGDTARSSLEAARRLVWELRPEPLEGASLPDALQRVCEQFEQKSAVTTAFLTTGQRAGLHPEIEIALLRGVQEALHNIEKHARATSVNVTLSYMGRVVMLDVTDDGAGFEPSQVESGSYGLKTMRERVAKLKGKLMVESEPGEGTAVVIEIPIERNL